MFSVSVVGTGNVGLHLYHVLVKSGYNVTLWGRKIKEISFLGSDIPVKTIDQLRPSENEVVFLCVPDDEIKNISKRLKHTDSLVCHVSGTQSLAAIQSKRKAVCYFFQSISKDDKDLDFKDIPVYIESIKNSDFTLLAGLAEQLGMQWRKLSSQERLRLHLCGVLINNFGNQLLDISAGVLKDTKLTLEDLKVLYDKTFEKALHLGPRQAQTGPAKRNDKATLLQHQNMLEKTDRDALKAYKTLSKRIKKNA